MWCPAAASGRGGTWSASHGAPSRWRRTTTTWWSKGVAELVTDPRDRRAHRRGGGRGWLAGRGGRVRDRAHRSVQRPVGGTGSVARVPRDPYEGQRPVRAGPGRCDVLDVRLRRPPDVLHGCPAGHPYVHPVRPASHSPARARRLRTWHRWAGQTLSTSQWSQVTASVPEVVEQGLAVLEAALAPSGTKLSTTEFDLGARRWHATGETLTDEDLGKIKSHDAILLGAIGDPSVPSGVLERGLLLKLRFALDHYVNLRPTKLYEGVSSPLAEPWRDRLRRGPRGHRGPVRRQRRRAARRHPARDRHRGQRQHGVRRRARGP